SRRVARAARRRGERGRERPFAWPVRSLSARAADARGQGGHDLRHRRQRAARVGTASQRCPGAYPHAGAASARCRAAVAAGAARCRLVAHPPRPPVAARLLPLLPDPRRGGPEGHVREGRMTKPLPPPPHTEPTAFTRDQLDWLPWLEPMAESALTPRHITALV